MATLGRHVARLRAMAADFQRNFEDLARQAELDELKREIDRAGEGEILAAPPPLRVDAPAPDAAATAAPEGEPAGSGEAHSGVRRP